MHIVAYKIFGEVTIPLYWKAKRHTQKEEQTIYEGGENRSYTLHGCYTAYIRSEISGYVSQPNQWVKSY